MRQLIRGACVPLFFAPVLFCAPLHAQDSATLRVDGRVRVFSVRDSVLVSEECAKSCEAVKRALKTSKKTAMSGALVDGGANPGSVICSGIGGEPRPAEELDADGSIYGERSVCAFGDGSMITTDSLHARAARNDRTGPPGRR